MQFLITLAIVVAFVLFAGNALKKHPYFFYIGSAVIGIIAFFCKNWNIPTWVNRFILGIFSNGIMGTALFVVVMYIGTLKNGSNLMKKLMPIRKELSILASVTILVHLVLYGSIYFVALFTNPASLNTQEIFSAIISLLLTILLIPLTITSFTKIRKKMKPVNWKNLQRLAYIFYALTYMHIMIVSLSNARAGMRHYMSNVVVYSIVFGVYLVLRIRKHCLIKQKKVLPLTTATAVFALIICGSLIVYAMPADDFTAKHGINDGHDSYEKENAQGNEYENENGDGPGNGYGMENHDEHGNGYGNGPHDGHGNGYGKGTHDGHGNGYGKGTHDRHGNGYGPKHEKPLNPSTDSDAPASDKPGFDSPNSDTPNSDIPNSNSSDSAASNSDTSNFDTSNFDTSSSSQTFSKDGQFTGSSVVERFNYTIDVTVTISGGKITDVVVNSDDVGGRDQQFLDHAATGVSTDGVDGVSGATFSANAIKKAYEAALKQAN